jgi:hypothetical protein
VRTYLRVCVGVCVFQGRWGNRPSNARKQNYAYYALRRGSVHNNVHTKHQRKQREFFMHIGSIDRRRWADRRDTQTVKAPVTWPHKCIIVQCNMCVSSGVSGSSSQVGMPSLGSPGKPLRVQASSQLLVQAISRHLPAHWPMLGIRVRTHSFMHSQMQFCPASARGAAASASATTASTTIIAAALAMFVGGRARFSSDDGSNFRRRRA